MSWFKIGFPGFYEMKWFRHFSDLKEDLADSRNTRTLDIVVETMYNLRSGRSVEAIITLVCNSYSIDRWIVREAIIHLKDLTFVRISRRDIAMSPSLTQRIVHEVEFAQITMAGIQFCERYRTHGRMRPFYHQLLIQKREELWKTTKTFALVVNSIAILVFTGIQAVNSFKPDEDKRPNKQASGPLLTTKPDTPRTSPIVKPNLAPVMRPNSATSKAVDVPCQPTSSR
jgi:hypothetical protein